MIGVTLISRNCLSQDYCLEEAIQSALPIADEIVVCDVGSTDGTRETLGIMASENPRIRIVDDVYDERQEGPPGVPLTSWVIRDNWLLRAREKARKALKSDYHFILDADEILHENEHERIRQLATGRVIARLVIVEFWRNSHSCYLRTKAVRMGPTSIVVIGDSGCLPNPGAINEPGVKLYHYGFLRDLQKWITKNKALQFSLCSLYDPALDEAEATQSAEPLWGRREREGLKAFTGTHPKYIQDWLKTHEHP